VELGRPWAIDSGVLRRRFAFSNFGADFALATRVALLAEREGHPLTCGWAGATARWSSRPTPPEG
jgi:pterin-4a-carbinolamine dehydratase